MGLAKPSIHQPVLDDVMPVPYVAPDLFMEKFLSSDRCSDDASYLVVDAVDLGDKPGDYLNDHIYVVSFSSVSRRISCYTVSTDLPFIVEVLVVAFLSKRSSGVALKVYMPDTYSIIAQMARKSNMDNDSLMCVCETVISVRDVTIALPSYKNKGEVPTADEVRRIWGLDYLVEDNKGGLKIDYDKTGRSCTKMFSMASATESRIHRYGLKLRSLYASQLSCAICCLNGFPVSYPNWRYMYEEMDVYHTTTFLKAVQYLSTVKAVNLAAGQEMEGKKIALENNRPDIAAWFSHANSAKGKKNFVNGMMCEEIKDHGRYYPHFHPVTKSGRVASMLKSQPTSISTKAYVKYKIFDVDSEVALFSLDFKYQELFVLSALAGGNFTGEDDPYIGLGPALKNSNHFNFPDDLSRDILKVAVLQTIYSAGPIRVHSLLAGTNTYVHRATAQTTRDIVVKHISKTLGIDLVSYETRLQKESQAKNGCVVGGFCTRRIYLPGGEEYKALNRAVQTAAACFFHLVFKDFHIQAYFDGLPLKLCMARYDEVWIETPASSFVEVSEIAVDMMRSLTKEVLGAAVPVKATDLKTR